MITERDAAYLAQRGISTTHAESYGLHSATSQEVRTLLERTDLTSGGLVVPYPTDDGDATVIRVRLHEPHIDREGKSVRYLQRKGTIVRPFVTRSANKYRHGMHPLVIVEGEAKALALEEAGFPAIGIPGVATWSAPREDKALPRCLHPAFDAFRWDKRAVVIAFDSDLVSKPRVQDEAFALAAQLTACKANIRLAMLSCALDGSKQGVDDLLARRGTATVKRLFNEAPPADKKVVQQYIKDHGLDRPVLLTTASSITPQRVRHWWEGWIPTGMVSLIVGAPGEGKTVTMIDRIARATQGQLEGEFFGVATDAVVATAEDAHESVFTPRLIAAGANLDRVHLVPLDGALSIPNDLARLEHTLRRSEAKIVFIDPLVAYLPGVINSWRDQDVRRALAPLSRMAEALNIAIVAVVHLNKSQATDVLSRVSGSIGMVAAARSVLLVASDPDDSTARVLAHAKSNVSEKAPSLRFRLETRFVHDGTIKTLGVTWVGTTAQQANDLLAERSTAAERSAGTDARSFLREVLAQGPVPYEKVGAEAKSAGISERTLDRAKADLKVRSVKGQGVQYGKWVWELPGKGANQECQPLYQTPLAPLAPLTETRVNTGDKDAISIKDANPHIEKTGVNSLPPEQSSPTSLPEEKALRVCRSRRWKCISAPEMVRRAVLKTLPHLDALPPFAARAMQMFQAEVVPND